MGLFEGFRGRKKVEGLKPTDNYKSTSSKFLFSLLNLTKTSIDVCNSFEVILNSLPQTERENIQKNKQVLNYLNNLNSSLETLKKAKQTILSSSHFNFKEDLQDKFIDLKENGEEIDSPFKTPEGFSFIDYFKLIENRKHKLEILHGDLQVMLNIDSRKNLH